MGLLFWGKGIQNMKIKRFLTIIIVSVFLFFGKTVHGINVIFEGINASGKTTVI